MSTGLIQGFYLERRVKVKWPQYAGSRGHKGFYVSRTGSSTKRTGGATGQVLTSDPPARAGVTWGLYWERGEGEREGIVYTVTSLGHREGR